MGDPAGSWEPGGGFLWSFAKTMRFSMFCACDIAQTMVFPWFCSLGFAKTMVFQGFAPGAAPKPWFFNVFGDKNP